ncbi:MAG TPA: hypothetical protein PKY77_26705 [Phycisphaerae bacterium]|nr:hypothetical protein [Phycisphaerae bacterium]
MFRNEALERGRFKRVPGRWQTEFGRWVADFGVPRIVAGLAHDPNLRITNQTVYEWIQGHAPQPARAMALVEMSQGRLTLEAIYQHSREVRQPEGASPGNDHGGPQ